MIKKLATLCAVFFSMNVLAAKPVCHSSSGGYCSYYGFVDRIYVNRGNSILIYFDTPMDEGEWDKAGFQATQRTAAAIKIDDQPEFAKLFYSTALTAQASKRPISIQMRGVHSGYLLADRIWLSE